MNVWEMLRFTSKMASVSRARTPSDEGNVEVNRTKLFYCVVSCWSLENACERRKPAKEILEKTYVYRPRCACFKVTVQSANALRSISGPREQLIRHWFGVLWFLSHRNSVHTRAVSVSASVEPALARAKV